MHTDLAVLAGCVSLVAAMPYIFDTVKGTTHPNVVTWLTWTLLNGINATAAFSTGAVQTGIFSSAAGITTGAILVAGLRAGLKRYSLFDISCQAAAIGGIILWMTTKSPGVAVLINLGVDFAGLLPTYRHVLRAPHAETWQMFALSAIAAVLTLVSIQHYSFIAIAPPAYICMANTVTVSTILVLRRVKRPTENLLIGVAES